MSLLIKLFDTLCEEKLSRNNTSFCPLTHRKTQVLLFEEKSKDEQKNI